MAQEYLNFKEISEKVLFEDVLNWLNIPFKKTEKELSSEQFIINIKKNLYFNPKDEHQKGSVINFFANFKSIEPREAASLLKAEFLSDKENVPKRNIPDLILSYHDYLKEKGISVEVAKEYEVGMVHQRSIMSSRIAFKVYSHTNENLGYVGYKIEKDNWLFPKGFKRPVYNLHSITNFDFVIVTVDPFEALRIITLGESNVVSLLASSMTNSQEDELRKFKTILILHKEPQNIIQRLSTSSFSKSIKLSKSLQEINSLELKNLINPT